MAEHAYTRRSLLGAPAAAAAFTIVKPELVRGAAPAKLFPGDAQIENWAYALAKAGKE